MSDLQNNDLIPEGLHPNTAMLVLLFAKALASKLKDAQDKYGYSNGWMDPSWMDECRTKLREHLEKGDPRDVAAYCAFLWHHGQSTASATVQALQPTPLRITLPDDTIITYHEGHKPNLGVLTVFDENDRKVEIVLSDSLAEALWHTVTPENAP